MSAPPQPRPSSAQEHRSPHQRPPSPPSAERSNVTTPVPGTTGSTHHSPAPPPPAHPPYPYEMPRGYGAGGYIYAPPPPGHGYHPDERYKHPVAYGYPPPPPPFAGPHGYTPYPVPGTTPPHVNGGGVSVPITYTDDAATKLSDRVRRRCFNCHTTETSTWRRSNMSSGKVLCNKCGLFERTHSRPRPDQFPHKRGPLATSSLDASRSPPQPEQAYASPAQNPTNGRAPAESGRTSVSQPGTPDSVNKSSVNGTPANSSSTTQLPAVESWAPKENAPGENGSSTPGTKKRPREEDEETSRREGDVGDVEKRAREV